MGGYKGPEDVRSEIYDSMPEEVAEVYLLLSRELQKLNLEWRWFNELYDNDRDTLDILNRSAATFFGNLQRIQIDSIAMRISKLLDRAKSSARKKRANASIDYMLVVLGRGGEEELRNRLNEQKGRLKASAEKIAAYRNRVAAHIDLETAAGREAMPKPAKEEFEAVLRGLGLVLNEIAKRFELNGVLYEHVIENGGAKNMVYVLSQGLEHRECRRRELDELRKRAQGDGEI